MSEDTVVKGPCPECGSSDNLATYPDGGHHCFTPGCKNHKSTGAAASSTTPRDPRLVWGGEVVAIPARGITAETCAKFQYMVGEYKGNKCHIAPYYRDGRVVAQKIRMRGKDFKVIGEGKDLPLFGANVWRDKGKMVVITEGEIDCLTVSQVQGNKWPVVSLPNGAQSARKTIKANLDWLEGFETVVLMFDNDDVGQAAALEAAGVFSPGKCKIARTPLKDANEMLLAGRGSEIIQCIWDAKAFRPDGIVSMADVWDRVKGGPANGTPYPWAGLTEKLNGIHAGQLITLTAGTGVGKSAVIGELAYHLAVTLGKKVGEVRLEENLARTARRYMGIHINKPLHLPGVEVPEEELRRAFEETIGTGNVVAYDHFGSLDPEVLMARIRYMVKSLDVSFVLLDHLSIVVSGLEIEDERKAIDVAMTKLRSLVEETGATLFVVVHLRRISESSKGHENGKEVSLSHLRGSQAIAQLSDVVIALERDQQAEEEEERNTTTVRVLKDRMAGETGLACSLIYHKDTGRLEEVGSFTFSEAL